MTQAADQDTGAEMPDPGPRSGGLSRLVSVLAVLVLSLLMAATVVCGLILQADVRVSEALNQRIIAGFSIRDELRGLYARMVESEAGFYGYVATGEPVFLEPLGMLGNQIPDAISRLEKSFTGRPDQLERLSQLRSAAGQKFAELSALARLRETQGEMAVRQRIAQGMGQSRLLRDQIGLLTDDILGAEQTGIVTALRDSAERYERARLIIPAMIIMSFASLGLAGLIGVLYVVRRRALERELALKAGLLALRERVAAAANQAETLRTALIATSDTLATVLPGPRLIAATVDRRTRHPSAVSVHGLAGPPALEQLTRLTRECFEILVPRLDPAAGTALVPVFEKPSRLGGFLTIELPSDAPKSARALLAGSVPALCELMTRVSERERTERKLGDQATRHAAIFTGASDSLIVLNQSGTIESINPAAERMFAVKAEDVLRRSFAVLVETVFPDLSPNERLRFTVSASAAGVVERLGRRPDGSTFPVEMSMSEIPLDNRVLFLAQIRDVTARRRVEQMKTEFVATVSHELRTPLTSIAGSLGLLAGGAAGALPERAGRLITIAHSNAQRLVRLINDILDIEKIESGKATFDMRSIDLVPLLLQTLDANRGFADTFGVTLSADLPEGAVMVRGDTDRLIQVVTNLVSNAVKFSPKGGTVTVSVRPHGAGWRIGVRDRGPGIPEEFQPRLFSKFAQADSSDTRQKGGTGLGLAIAREIVLRHGGAIGFETAAGMGTEFQVDLPRLDAPVLALPPRGDELAPPVLASQAMPRGRPRVLVLSAGTVPPQTLAEGFARSGFDMDHAATIDEVRGLALLEGYAAVLIDLTSLAGEAEAMLSAVKSDPRMVNVPIVILNLEGGQSERPDITRLLSTVREAIDGAPNRQPRVLHVDDDPDVRTVVATAFSGRADITSVHSLDSARQKLTGATYDLVILDIGLGDGSGLDLLPDLKSPKVPVVVFSAQDPQPGVSPRVEAYLTKSRATISTLVDVVESLARHQGADGTPPRS
ncbi:ATP-binding protein [Segnochrobactraceae bacterium EtOH-i3]